MSSPSLGRAVEELDLGDGAVGVGGRCRETHRGRGREGRAVRRLCQHDGRRRVILDADHARDRRHTVRVEDEEHVGPRWGDVGIGRRGGGDARRAGSERQRDIALLHVVRVGDSAEADESHLANGRWVGRRDLDRHAVGRSRRRRADGGTGRERAVGLEEVGRREDLRVLGQIADLVAGAADPAAGRQHAPVGQQERS